MTGKVRWGVLGAANITLLLVQSFAYALIALGLNIQWGYGGLFNFGIMGFDKQTGRRKWVREDGYGLGNESTIWVSTLKPGWSWERNAMPRMGGIEFHAVLRSDPAFAAIPVLFVSGESTLVPEGALLQKPFNARTVRAAVQSVLSPPEG